MTEQETEALARETFKVLNGFTDEDMAYWANQKVIKRDMPTILAAFRRVATESFNAGVDAVVERSSSEFHPEDSVIRALKKPVTR